MKCPFCDHEETRVLDSRLIAEQQQIRRRRVCMQCNERFNTNEVPVLQWPRILKRDLRREPFIEQKLRSGIMRAFEKRPVTTEQIENLLSQIKKRLISYPEREIPSALLGRWVLEGLKNIDELALLRFASIYKRFKTVEEFYTLITTLMEESSGE